MGNIEFRSGKPSFLPPQRTAVPIKENGVNDLNKSFNKRVKMLHVSSNPLDFLDFLQSAECEEILVQNKLKIHVESGNIFHSNIDTNESIYSFFSAARRFF